MASEITTWFEQFQDELEEAADRAYPEIMHNYNAVLVFSITWAESDMNVADLEERLCRIFSSTFRYRIARHQIIHRRDGQRLSERVMFAELITHLVQFALGARDQVQREIARPGANEFNKLLLIVLYFGHAFPLNDNSELLLTPRVRSNPGDPHLDLNLIIRQHFFGPEFDLACIIGYSYGLEILEIGDRNIECLIAGGGDLNTSEQRLRTYMNALCRTLEETAAYAPSFVSLHSQVFDQVATDGGMLLPQHVRIANYASIRLNNPERPVYEVEASPSVYPAAVAGTPAVDVRVRLRGDVSDVPNAEDWTDWVRGTIPTRMRVIELSNLANLGDDTYMLNARLPLPIWLYMGRSPTYEMLAMYRSGVDLSMESNHRVAGTRPALGHFSNGVHNDDGTPTSEVGE